MLKLLSPSYLFDTTPGQEFQYFWLLLIYFLLLIAIGQYIRTYIRAHHHKKILKRLYPGIAGKLALMAALGFMFLFFRHENIPYLALRPFLIIILIVSLYYLGKSVYIYIKVLPKEIAKKEKKESFDKYLPTPKKKKKKKR